MRTIPALASTLGISNRSIEKNPRALQEAGKLRRVGPDKGGRWEPSYLAAGALGVRVAAHCETRRTSHRPLYQG